MSCLAMCIETNMFVKPKVIIMIHYTDCSIYLWISTINESH